MIALFIAIGITLVLFVSFVITYPLLKKRQLKRDFVSVYGRRVYKYALHNDLYLINKLELKANDDQILKVDHLLFGTKYIYVIKDYHFPGEIEAKEKDRSFVYKSNQKDAKKIYIDNPMPINKKLTQKLSANIGLKSDLFITISLFNDDTDFGDFASTSKDNYIVTLSKLKKLLDSLESRNIAPLNDEQLKYAVKDVANLNLNKHGKK